MYAIALICRNAIAFKSARVAAQTETTIGQPS